MRMRVAVVHTAGSSCRCAESVAAGLRALGHEMRFVDSEAIEAEVRGIAEWCDLVFDHTDTYRGSGLMRSFVRLLLESQGARIVGSGAGACMLADNKIAARTRLADAGIPVPPGIAVTSRNQEWPEWLRTPVVLKPAFEHMSRGLCLAGNMAGIRDGIAALLDRYGQPVLAETYIPGRELAVSVLEEDDGLNVLPPLEWRMQPGEPNLLTKAFKESEVEEGREDASRASLPAGLAADLEGFSRLAFRTLGLRDYARFDVRLSPGGTLYFLEANTTPSFEPQEALALSARWAGMDYPVLVAAMLSAAQRRYGCAPLIREEEKKRLILPAGPVDLRISAGVHRPPASTLELAGLLDVRAGEDALDLGCGTGILAIAMTKRGARRVVAVDIRSEALEATRRNAAANGVADRIEIRAGAWYEALNGLSPEDAGRFDVIAATPPQTAGPRPFGPRYGGPDGLKHLTAVLEGAPFFLKRAGGRLWLMVVSLADSSELLCRLRGRFRHVAVVRETERPFTGSEYDGMEAGLMDHLLELRASGRSDFRDAGAGKYVFRNLFIRAGGVKRP
ncbi:MAG: D-alanine--D-alanine ligase B [Syntrophaceae bacterium PtaB.Bin095]|nr:MAG: D-alanine--D-alanine ligase B [Syntrophaceae bacterium PtaB.Bin095]